MRNASDKSCAENQNTPFLFSNVFPKIVVCDVMLKNVVQPERQQMTIRYGACALHAGYARLHARTNTHTPTGLTAPNTHLRSHMHTGKYVIRIAFPRQHWFREHTSKLRYTYIASHDSKIIRKYVCSLIKVRPLHLFFLTRFVTNFTFVTSVVRINVIQSLAHKC